MSETPEVVVHADEENKTITYEGPFPPTEGEKAKLVVPSVTLHALPTPDGNGFAPVKVSWTIKGGVYQASKVQWADTDTNMRQLKQAAATQFAEDSKGGAQMDSTHE